MNQKTDTINQDVSQELTIERLKDFRPNDEQINVAKEVFVKMALVETIKPIVREYQTKVLNELQVKPSKEMATDEIITNPERSYLMSDSDFEVYAKRTNEERIKAGLYVKDPEYCPLLVAEDELNKAESKLIESMKPLTGISKHNLLCCKNGIERFNKYIDMMLGLISHHVDFRVI